MTIMQVVSAAEIVHFDPSLYGVRLVQTEDEADIAARIASDIGLIVDVKGDPREAANTYFRYYETHNRYCRENDIPFGHNSSLYRQRAEVVVAAGGAVLALTRSSDAQEFKLFDQLFKDAIAAEA